MYKNLFIAAAAVAVLASCTKNEVNPVSVPEQEISYQAVVGPKTKSHDTFGDGNVFVSYAYMYPDKNASNADNSWNSGDAYDIKEFIPGKTIHKDVEVWRPTGTDRYYWPAGYKVTFFAWSLKRQNINSDATVKCDTKKGIFIDNYDATLGNNKNADFMVADRAADKTGNANTYYTDGVPTLFRHQLCQVRYAVRLNHSYTSRDFKLKEVTFTNIAQKGNYQQFDNNGSIELSQPSTETSPWTVATEKVPYTYNSSKAVAGNSLTYPNGDDNGYRPKKTDWEPEDGSTSAWNVSTDQFYFIPQTIGNDAKIKISYEYVYTPEDGAPTTIIVNKEKDLKDIFEKWEKNHIYTINITIGLNEILWDPAVEEWENVDSPDWDTSIL